MYQLYYSPGACSMAPHVVLNEIGATYELKKVDMQGDRSELLKVNPLNAVPVLVDDGLVITEGAAILIHLLENNKNDLLPKSGKERTKALEALCFANATLHPAYGKAFWVAFKANFSTQTAKDEAFHSTFAQINKLWEHIEQKLAKQKYLAGDKITVADILVTVIANWNSYFPGKVNLGPNVKRLIKEISSRPTYQLAMKEEEIEYKAAA